MQALFLGGFFILISFNDVFSIRSEVIKKKARISFVDPLPSLSLRLINFFFVLAMATSR